MYRYSGWHDLYRPDYTYRRGYDDYDWDYGYRRGRYYDDYDDWDYVPRRWRYYDDHDDYYDYDYGYRGGSGGCLACRSRGPRRGRVVVDSPYIYRSEESRPPRHRQEDRGERRGRGRHRSPKVRVDKSDTGPAGTGNANVDVYAVPDVSGQTGFKDRTRNDHKPRPKRSEPPRRTEPDSFHRGRHRRHEERTREPRRRPEYDDDDFFGYC